jgi:photosystem II stability/assembly factor-like uncharacterized protein
MKNNITILVLLFSLSASAQSWKTLPFDQTTHQDKYNDLYFHSETNGHMVGDNWSYLKTFDAGKTWIKKDISSLHDSVFTRVIFLDDSVGFLQGVGRFYKTLNGGNSWTTINLGVYRNQIGISNGQVFAYGDSGFGGLYFSRYFPANDSFHTQNGAWSMYDLTNLEYVGDSILYLSKDSGNIYKSTDFGQTLTLSFSDSTIKSRVKDIYFISKDTGYVIYENAKFAITFNGGNNWHLDDTSLFDTWGPRKVSLFEEWDNKLFFTAASYGNFGGFTNVMFFEHGILKTDTSIFSIYLYSPFVRGSVSRLYSFLPTSSTDTSSYLYYKSEKLLSINNIRTNPLHLRVYPNPSSGKFTIELPSLDIKNLEVETVNTIGQRTKQEIYFTGNLITLKIEESGIHFLHVYQKGNLIYSGKLIVQ